MKFQWKATSANQTPNNLQDGMNCITKSATVKAALAAVQTVTVQHVQKVPCICPSLVYIPLHHGVEMKMRLCNGMWATR